MAKVGETLALARSDVMIRLLSLVFFFALTPFFAFAENGAAALAAADTAYESLLKTYWEPARGDFTGSGNYWFYAQSIDVAVLAAVRNPAPNNVRRIDVLYQQQAKRGYLQTRNPFFDDENWMALSLARAAQATNDARYLQTATELFDDVLSRGTRGRTEGVWWNYEYKKVATASNAGPVITGVLLWRLKGDARYLDFAKRTYAYWLREMIAPVSNQVYDQILADGSKDKTPYSYDQGLMIGAAIELYRETHDQVYLDQARGFAQYMLDQMRATNGVMLEETCIKVRVQCRGWKDVAQFKGIGFRYLVELLKEDPGNVELRKYLTDTAHAIMSPSVYDPVSGRFAYEWDGSEPPSGGYYQTANSAALALAAYASLFQ